MLCNDRDDMEHLTDLPLPGAMDMWVRWIESQPVKRWRIVTLEYPRWSNLDLWRKALKQTMRELDQTFLKGSIASQNKATGAEYLRRVVAMGGDQQRGVAYHAHCLIDGIGDDEKFELKLRTSWTNNVRKIAFEGNRKFYEPEAAIYSRKAVNGVSEYLYYIVRHEGHDLKFGVDKVEVSPTYLTPPAF